MNRDTIKVVIYGLGGVGKELVHDFDKRNDLELVGVCLLYTSRCV